MIRCYSELKHFDNFLDRYNYLRIGGIVGEQTFGFDRYLNQSFYTSRRWRRTRDKVILRDDGCDLGIPGYDIEKILIHHMNPITIEDVENDADWIYDPEFLICTSFYTHQAIHYGDSSLLPKEPIERKPFDTCPWRIR